MGLTLLTTRNNSYFFLEQKVKWYVLFRALKEIFNTVLANFKGIECSMCTTYSNPSLIVPYTFRFLNIKGASTVQYLFHKPKHRRYNLSTSIDTVPHPTKDSSLTTKDRHYKTNTKISQTQPKFSPCPHVFLRDRMMGNPGCATCVSAKCADKEGIDLTMCIQAAP
jgi:hypothetical protein